MSSRWLLLQLVQLNLCIRSVLLSNFCMLSKSKLDFENKLVSLLERNCYL
ncbi:hypothetical protein Hanom_Chr05g00414981 [Helianthus anomalus]